MTVPHNNLLPRLAVWTGLVVLFLVVSLSGAAFWLTTDDGESFLREQLASLLSSVWERPIVIGSLSTNVLGYVEIDNFRLGGETDSLSTIGFDRLRIEYRPWQLLFRRLSLGDVRLSGLDVAVVQDSTGILFSGRGNETVAAEGDSVSGDGGFPLDVHVGNLDIFNAFLQYNNRSLTFDSALHGAFFSLENPGNDERYDVYMSADSLEFGYEDIRSRSGALVVDGTYDGGVLDLLTMNMQFPGGDASGSFAVDFRGTDMVIDGNLRYSGDLGGLAESAGSLIPNAIRPVEGAITAEVILQYQRTLEVEGGVDLHSVTVAGVSVDGGRIDLAYAADSLAVTDVSLAAFGGVLAGAGTIAFSPAVSHSASLTMSNISLSRFLQHFAGDAHGYDGRLSGSVETGGSLSAVNGLHAAADLRGTHLALHSQPVATTNLSASLSRGALSASVRQPGNQVDVSGTVLSDSLFITYHARADSLEDIGRLIGLPFTGSGDIEGEYALVKANHRFETRFRGTGVMYTDYPLGTVDGSVLYDGETWRLGPTTAEASRAPGDTLAALAGLDGLRAGFSYIARVSGPFDDMQGSGSIEVREPEYMGVHFADGEADIAFDNEGLELSSLVLREDSLQVRGSGRVDFAPFAGTLDMDVLPLSGGTIGTDTGGTASFGSAVLSFASSDSGTWSVDASVDTLRLERIGEVYRKWPNVVGTLSGTAVMRGLPALPDGDMAIRVDGPRMFGLTADSVSVAADISPGGIDLHSVSLARNGESLAGHMSISRRGNASLMDPDNRVEGVLTSEGLGLTLFEPYLPDGMNIGGEAVLRVSWDGLLGKPSIDGILQVMNGTISDAGGSLGENITLSAQFDDTDFVIDSMSGTFRESPLFLTGWVEFDRMPDISFEISGGLSGAEVFFGAGRVSPDDLDMEFMLDAMDLQLVRPFLPQLKELQGTADGSLAVGGSFAHPDMHGSLDLDGVYFKTDVFNRPWTNGILRATFDGSTVSVDTLSMASNEGTINGHGTLTFGEGGLSAVDLRTMMRNVKIDQPDIYSFFVETAAVNVTGDGRSYSVSGDVVIAEGTVEYDLQPQEFVGGRAVPPEEPSDMMKNTRLSVRVSNAKPLLVDNNLAHVEWDANIEIAGTAAKPNITGRISAEDGYVLYLDRQFTLSQATLDFVDPNRINPIIDFTAVTNIQQTQTFAGETYAITLTVNGSLDEASIVLDSSPDLGRADILSLLTFGATTDQIAGTGGRANGQDTGAIVTERVMQISERVASNYLSRKASSILGIEGLVIQGNVFGADGGSGTTKASERLQRQLESDYSTQVGQSNERGIRLRYDVSDMFSLEGYTDQTGRSGLDFEYSITFK